MQETIEPIIETQIIQSKSNKTDEIEIQINDSKDNASQTKRYKKETLQDYIPKQTIVLPEEEIEQKVLIEFPNKADSNGVTLLMIACKNGNDWELNNLLNSGADVNLKDNHGWTALMYAVRYQQNINIIDSLLNKGAIVKEKNNLGFSALILASTYNDNPLIIKKLLEFYQTNEKEVFKSFILCISSSSINQHSYIAKISTFLDYGVPLNSFYEGKTPLMYCAINSKTSKALKLLIDNGAYTQIRSTENKTAFDYAIENKSLQLDENFWSLNNK